MTYYKSPRNKPRKPVEDRPIVPIDTHVGKETLGLLRAVSAQLEVPVSQLIARAIDNELDAPKPFNYPCPEPDTEFVEGQYFGEAQRVYQFLKEFKKGADIETLMLNRREMGISSRSVLMHALRELLNTSLVEYFRPRRTVFDYSPEYRRIRIVEEDPKELKKDRYNRVEPEAKDEQTQE